MSKKRICRGCEQPGPDIIIKSAGLEIPYHTECAAELERDLRAIRDRVTDYLLARSRDRGPASGPLLTKESH
jgi:hypothetical protein